jgi:uncharacterized membrane protein YbhN (UPF0104 family)
VAALPEARTAAADLSAIGLPVLAGAVALEAAALACYSALTMQMLRPVRDIRFGTVLRIDLAVYGLTRVLPAAPVSGAALRLRLLTAAGVRRTPALFVAGVEGTGSALLLHVLLGVTLLVSLPAQGGGLGSTVAATLGAVQLTVAAAVVTVLVRGGATLGRIARLVVRVLPTLDLRQVEATLRREGTQLRLMGQDHPRLAAACAWATANWVLDAAALWLVLAAAGYPADPLELFTGYALAGVLAVLPLTPGGIGIVEGVLIPTLTGFGAPAQVALVGVLGWRLVSFWLPIPVGALSWLTLRRHRRDKGPAATPRPAAGGSERLEVSDSETTPHRGRGALSARADRPFPGRAAQSTLVDEQPTSPRVRPTRGPTNDH